jgi:iron complex outermembrane receptor protein
MKKRVGLILGAVLLNVAPVGRVWAQKQDGLQPALELEETVVTATRAETPVENLPVSVTVITGQDIEKMPVKTVDEVLDKAAGLQVRRNKGLCNTGSHTTIYMRGTGESSRVLVLKDGIPLNLGYTGSVDVWNTLSLENIEKIEIVRGAASALYGSSAMGGVINIITKKPSRKPSGSVEIQGGSLDTYIGNASISAGTERFALRASGGHKRTDGYEYYEGDDWKDYYKKPESRLTNASVGGDIWLGESLLRLDYDYMLEDSLTTTSTQYDGEQEHHNYMLGYELPLGVVDLSLKSYYFDVDSGTDARKHNAVSGRFDEFYYESTIPKDEYGLMLQASAELANHRLTVGSDLKRATCESNYTYATTATVSGSGDRNFSGKQDFYSLFVNDEVSFLDERLILSAGVRYDHWKNYDGDFYDSTTGTDIRIDYPDKSDEAVSPRAGAVFKVTEKAKLRASFGTGFKAPSLYYLYKSGPHGAARFDLANPDLDAEKMVWSYDVGFDIRPNDQLSLSMTFYQSRFEDFLGDKTLDSAEVPSWFSPDPGMAVIQKVNLGRVDIHGVEAGLEYKFDDRWSAFINHTYNVSKIKEYDPDPGIEGNYLSYTPRHMTKIGVTYDNPKIFTLSVFLTHVGERYGDLENSDNKKLGAYQVVDLKISRKLFTGLEIFGSVNNLTDEKYEEYSGTYNPPFTVMAGAKYTF